MKANEFIAHVTTRIEDNAVALASVQAQIQDCDVVDQLEELKASESVIKHRMRFLALLNNDEIAKSVAALKITAAQLIEVEKDAKSLAKAAELFAALKNNRRISVDADDALAQAVAHFVATNFATISAESLRRSLFSKRSNYTVAHSTKRQAQMILNLLARLNVCAKKTRDEFEFTDNVIVQKLNSIYQS